MRRLGWCVLVLLAACGSKSDDFPVGGGGGRGSSGGGGHGADSATDGPMDAVLAIDANMFMGRVCLVSDARKLTNPANCSATDAGGLTIRLGNQSTTTAADGSFSIVGDPAATPIWRVSGAAVVSSYAPLGNYYVPALTQAGYTTLTSQNSVTTVPGQGDVMVLELHNGMGNAGVTAISNTTPAPLYSTFYSTTLGTGWAQGGATDAQGMAWLPGINVGTTQITSTSAAMVDLVNQNVPVYDGGVTFIQVVFP